VQGFEPLDDRVVDLAGVECRQRRNTFRTDRDAGQRALDAIANALTALNTTHFLDAINAITDVDNAGLTQQLQELVAAVQTVQQQVREHQRIGANELLAHATQREAREANAPGGDALSTASEPLGASVFSAVQRLGLRALRQVACHMSAIGV